MFKILKKSTYDRFLSDGKRLRGEIESLYRELRAAAKTSPSAKLTQAYEQLQQDVAIKEQDIRWHEDNRMRLEGQIDAAASELEQLRADNAKQLELSIGEMVVKILKKHGV